MAELTVRTAGLVLLALLVLLGATLAVTLLPPGPLHPVLSLAIAFGKAALIAMFFMHVRYRPPVVGLFAVVGLMWLVILMGLTLADYMTRA